MFRRWFTQAQRDPAGRVEDRTTRLAPTDLHKKYAPRIPLKPSGPSGAMSQSAATVLRQPGQGEFWVGKRVRFAAPNTGHMFDCDSQPLIMDNIWGPAFGRIQACFVGFLTAPPIGQSVEHFYDTRCHKLFASICRIKPSGYPGHLPPTEAEVQAKGTR